MNEESKTLRNEIGTLAQDAHALMTATADVAGEKVGEARKRLAAALESAKAIADRIRVKAVESAKAAEAKAKPEAGPEAKPEARSSGTIKARPAAGSAGKAARDSNE